MVSFDPRGIGQSTVLQCFATIGQEQQLLSGASEGYPVGAAQQRAWENTYAPFDKACAAHAGPLLAHDSTADIARDMDLLRRAVGDPTLNYLGISYGTYLGATYANLFPDKVRAMVLDGNVDPVAVATGTTAPRASEQLAAADPTRVRGRPERVPRPVRPGPGQFLRVLRGQPGRHPRQVRHPAEPAGTPSGHHCGDDLHQGGRRGHGGQRAVLGPADTEPDERVVRPGHRPGGPVGSDQRRARAGHDPVARQALRAAGQRRPAGRRRAVLGPGIGAWRALLRQPEPADPRRSTRRRTPWRTARSGVVGPDWVWPPMEACAQWPVLARDRYTGPFNRPTAAPILVVGNTVDPATPYQDAVAMSHDLANARLLTVDGYGHTALANPSNCVAAAEDAYFVTGTLPPPGTVCHQNVPVRRVIPDPDPSPATGGLRTHFRRPFVRHEQTVRAVDRGAEVICLGCAGMTGIEQHLRDRIRVTDINGVAAAVALVEALIRNGFSTSKIGSYARPRSKMRTWAAAARCSAPVPTAVREYPAIGIGRATHMVGKGRPP